MKTTCHLEATDVTDEAEAAQAARIEHDEGERAFARDMADAVSSLRRDRRLQRRVFAFTSRCRATSRARRTRKAGRVRSAGKVASGDAPPPGDPPGRTALGGSS